MKAARKLLPVLLLVFIIFVSVPLLVSHSYGAYNCANGASDPPFLAAGLDPNLLLLIDNSASMYDLANVDPDESYCNDDTYDGTRDYAGYFDLSTWYAYDETGEAFVAETTGGNTLCDASGGTIYKNEDLCVAIDKAPTPNVVKKFAANGNFLNWTAASKMDIQKKILTGGKYMTAGNYGATVNSLVMESRGCTERRFVKEVPVSMGGITYYLTLAVRPPMEETFPSWDIGRNYTAGDIVSYGAVLYQANTTHTSVIDDLTTDGILDAVKWDPYNKTRWVSGQPYTKGDIVSFDGDMYIAASTGTAAGTEPGNDSGVSWTPYHVTHIEIFDTSSNGFDNEACEQAITEISADPPNLGQIYQSVDDCMAYPNPSDVEGNGNAAFNHSLQNCWKWTKFPDTQWDVTEGDKNSITTACENIYDELDPWEITYGFSGYACYGWYTETDQGGYLGRCWDPGGGMVCTKYKKDGTCLKWEVTAGGSEPGWRTDVPSCIEEAIVDYCSDMTVPEVIDPSDEVSETGEFFNLPAVLIDSGVVTQMGQPLTVMKGYIKQDSAPTGLLHEFADDIRIGAMKFNHDGSDSECDFPEQDVIDEIAYACDDPDNKDGGQVIKAIGKNSAATPDHTAELVSQINDIQADSWTPIAEAFYTAIGYFTQREAMKLQTDDFSTTVPPCVEWCQNNNILIITEGASTADLNPEVTTFASVEGVSDPDTDDNSGCDSLFGGTFLDDMAYYARSGQNIFLEDPYDAEEHFQNIKTYIVVAGTPRTEGTGECSPKTLLDNAAANGGTVAPYYANNPEELQDNLKTVFNIIRAGAAAGSAASVISASRGGEGAIYQAIFWPSVDGPQDKPAVTWTGEIHSLLMDAYGVFYEDSNGDRALTVDDMGNITDEKVTLYFDTTVNESKACFGGLDTDGSCIGTSKALSQVKYLWSAAEWLANISESDISLNRSDYISSVERKRYIFTWNDLNNNGAVEAGNGLDDNEVLSFVPTKDWSTASLPVAAGRAPVTLDFGVQTSGEVNSIVSWVRGKDDLVDTTLRPREVPTPANFSITGSPATITWRLGDVVHSTPTAVSRPAEGYHFLYYDESYAGFVNQYQHRRHVIYFGGNDGMVHAVNGGFFDDANKKFWLASSVDASGVVSYSDNGPDLGAELWAYVPFNLLPHLKCLKEPDYIHKYFVDLKPRVFDVQIFSPDAVHPQGWGTILVVGMRFGGSRITAQEIDLADGTFDYPADNRVFSSSYVILDITDPESPPTLLGELTYDPGSSVDIGFTSSVPTVVPMKEGNSSVWYLVLGSGPTELSGVSTQNAKIGVYPLDLLVNGSSFQIPTTAPGLLPGSYTLANSPNGFVSDSISVDFDLVENYKADVVYFGTVEGSWGNWNGKMYRLVTNEDTPDGWDDPNTTMLIDIGRPITAAPSVGYDGSSYWVYFGSGRFFDKKDKSDGGPGDDGSNGQEAFYGIKEPMDCNREFTWDTVANLDALDSPPATSDLPGNRKLLRSDPIEVAQALSSATALLNCKDGSTDCLPSVEGSKITNFTELVSYIAGSGCVYNDTGTAVGFSGTDGWYLELQDDRERNLGQGALLGGLMTFTTYQPFEDVCRPEGEAFLYGVYYQTGTAWYEAVFTSQSDGGTEGDPPKVVSRLALGRGLATTPNLHVGRQEGSKAFVQTSTGAIIEIPQPNLPIKMTKSGRMSWRNQ